MKWQGLLPPTIYMAGLVCLFGADMLIANHANPEQIEQWAEIRSLIGITAVLCVAGLDQTLVRSPQSSLRLLTILPGQVTGIALLAGFAMAWLFGRPIWYIGAGIAAGAAGSLIAFQYYRAHGFKTLSQISQQIWKITAFIYIFIIFILDIDAPFQEVIVALLFFCSIFSLSTIFYFYPQSMREQNPEPIPALYAISSRFMLTSLLVALSVYAEQLLVIYFGNEQQAATYFIHATYFLFPVSLVNGYVAFLITPWIRDNLALFLHKLTSGPIIIALVIVIYCLALQLAAWLGWTFLRPGDDRPDYALQFLFFCVAVCRSCYILPSGFFGAFGKPRDHDQLILLQLLAAAVAVIVFLAGNTYGLAVIYTVASASLINWVLRSLAGYFMIFKIAKARA